MSLYTDRPDACEQDASMGEVCVVMFSGGRDSTLAALRLFEQRYRLVLVTVTSEHLTGIQQVERRLDELRSRLRMSATWIHVVQPSRFTLAMQPAHRTCLPCHAAYSGLGLRLALDNGATSVAFGYTDYQSNWLEQTPQAIQLLRQHMRKEGVELLLPVRGLSSKVEAIRELQLAGVSHDALEQKCLVQQFNETLCPAEIATELDRWDHALEQTFQLAKSENLQIMRRVVLGPDEASHD